MNNNEVYPTFPHAAVGDDGAAMTPYAEFHDGDVRRDYGPQGCAGIVLKSAAFLALVGVMALLRLAGVQ